jgi:hypothetical protein
MRREAGRRRQDDSFSQVICGRFEGSRRLFCFCAKNLECGSPATAFFGLQLATSAKAEAGIPHSRSYRSRPRKLEPWGMRVAKFSATVWPMSANVERTPKSLPSF